MTRRALAELGKATFVRVFVAGIAVASRRLGRRRGMARSTRLFVRTFECKARLVVVIEVNGLPIDLGAVTERALFLTEQRLTVDVFVTRRAVHRPVGQSEHRARVTAIARNARVLGLDREARVLVVIKLRRIERAPVLGIVAALAVGDLFV